MPTHLIGMLLGTEEDWPGAFEALVRRAGLVVDAGGERHMFTGTGHHRAFRSTGPPPTCSRPGPPGLLVLRAPGVAEEGGPHERRLSAQQSFHVSGYGEARRLLRHDPAWPPRSEDVDAAAQGARRQSPLPVHRAEVQPAIRPRCHRGADRVPAVHEALRRGRMGWRDAYREQRGTARQLRRLR